MITVKSLNKHYAKDAPVLRGVCFELPQRQFGAIVGPSGSGKSTLLNIVAGLDLPDSGTVSILGRELTSMSAEQLAQFRLRQVGIVFQFFNFLPTLTILQNVEIPGHLAGAPRREVQQRALELLRSVEIDALRTRFPHEVSGGEIQRAAIARALMNKPQLILADEPTGNLDQRSGARTIELLRQLIELYAVTLLVVSHDPRVVEHADKILRLEDGVLQP